MPDHPDDEVRFKQILTPEFQTETGSTYSTLGLSEDGCVYRYDPKCEGWIPWSMKVAGCRNDHKAKR